MRELSTCVSFHSAVDWRTAHSTTVLAARVFVGAPLASRSQALDPGIKRLGSLRAQLQLRARRAEADLAEQPAGRGGGHLEGVVLRAAERGRASGAAHAEEALLRAQRRAVGLVGRGAAEAVQEEVVREHSIDADPGAQHRALVAQPPLVHDQQARRRRRRRSVLGLRGGLGLGLGSGLGFGSGLGVGRGVGASRPARRWR